jgi:DNA-binding protein H-NS
MKAPDLKGLSDDELMAMQAQLKDFLTKRMSAKKSEALAQIKSLVIQYDLTYDDVSKCLPTPPKRSKAPAVYRNPDKPRQTWSGKGEPPQWFTDAPDKEALRIIS